MHGASGTHPPAHGVVSAKDRAVERGWTSVDADEAADVVVAAMAAAGVEHLFFTSGSDLAALQEAVSKAEARSQPAPRIITAVHEAVGLNGAVGSAMVSGKPAATAVHVDVGIQNWGCAVHNAYASGAPVLLIGGSPPRAYPGSMRGAKDHPVLWVQERQDQRRLVDDYVKWSFRVEAQDDPGLAISRALHVASSPPTGPAFLSLPRELLMGPARVAGYPSLAMLGRVTPAAPDPSAIDEVAGWLVDAERPLIIAGRSGKDPKAVVALVALAELVGAGVTDNGFFGDRLSFPRTHPLWQTGVDPCDADVVLVVDNHVPWVPQPDERLASWSDGGEDPADRMLDDPHRAPTSECRIAWLSEDPLAVDIPMLEHAADLRVTTDPYLGLAALTAAVEDRMSSARRSLARDRVGSATARQVARYEAAERAAQAVKSRQPIDPRWLARAIGKIVDREAVFLNEALGSAPLVSRYYRGDRPGAFFNTGGSGGGFGPGGALGIKLAEPERDVIHATGDGYYMFGVPQAALWSAARYAAPFLTIVFVNGRWSTGHEELELQYPQGHALRAGSPGGSFEPAPDFAAEARAAGAHGVLVDDPHELDAALRDGLAATRDGQAAVLAVRVS